MIATKEAGARTRRWGICLLLIAWCVLWAVPASAEDAEHITSYDVALAVRVGGSLHVTETIAYDFGTNQRHGIFRAIPQKCPTTMNIFASTHFTISR
jgi:Predicted membrane protein (DUF2207)